MVKVIKRNKKIEVFQTKKIVKACKGAGMSPALAETIAKMVFAKIKKRKTVKSTDIKKMIFDICKKMGKVPDTWSKHENAKKKKRAAKKKKPVKKKAKKKAVKKKKVAKKKKSVKRKAKKKR